jgi:hypothetical protein
MARFKYLEGCLWFIIVFCISALVTRHGFLP